MNSSRARSRPLHGNFPLLNNPFRLSFHKRLVQAGRLHAQQALAVVVHALLCPVQSGSDLSQFAFQFRNSLEMVHKFLRVRNSLALLFLIPIGLGQELCQNLSEVVSGTSPVRCVRRPHGDRFWGQSDWGYSPKTGSAAVLIWGLAASQGQERISGLTGPALSTGGTRMAHRQWTRTYSFFRNRPFCT
jgi:hypothetical protein